MKPLTRRLIKKEVDTCYIYIGLTRAKDFPDPREEFTITVNGRDYKAHTYDWHCACPCPNPVHVHRCIDIKALKYLLPKGHPTLIITKVRDRVYDLEIVREKS
ncbi:hypothetical protein JXM67_09850 [candidate division WOR-3 bacterium]|nr:hypothetical protein [candidate division WOR-3 bacterium]